MAKQPKKQAVTRRELGELGLSAVDSTKSKAPAYRRNKRKKEIIEILSKNLGNVTAACEKVGISRATFYDWRRTDADFDEAITEINERTLDFVEGQLLTGISAGNAKLIIFYLVNRGKSRGYSRKPEEAEVRDVDAATTAAELARAHLEALGIAPKGLPLEELARLVAAKVAEGD